MKRSKLVAILGFAGSVLLVGQPAHAFNAGTVACDAVLVQQTIFLSGQTDVNLAIHSLLDEQRYDEVRKRGKAGGSYGGFSGSGSYNEFRERRSGILQQHSYNYDSTTSRSVLIRKLDQGAAEKWSECIKQITEVGLYAWPVYSEDSNSLTVNYKWEAAPGETGEKVVEISIYNGRLQLARSESSDKTVNVKKKIEPDGSGIIVVFQNNISFSTIITLEILGLFSDSIEFPPNPIIKLPKIEALKTDYLECWGDSLKETCKRNRCVLTAADYRFIPESAWLDPKEESIDSPHNHWKITRKTPYSICWEIYGPGESKLSVLLNYKRYLIPLDN